MSQRQLHSVIVMIIIITIGLASWWLLWRGDAEPILSQANQVKVPSGWKLTEEKIVKKQNLCLDKLGCPGISRTWRADRKYSKAELEQVFEPLGIKIERECQDSVGTTGTAVNVCSGKSLREQQYYSVYETTNDTRSEYTISMFAKIRFKE